MPGSSWNDISVVADSVLAPATTPVDGADATTKLPDGDSVPGDGPWAAASPPAPTPAAWAGDSMEPSGNGSAVPTAQLQKSKLNAAKSKSPATSKLSWAQVARYAILSTLYSGLLTAFKVRKKNQQHHLLLQQPRILRCPQIQQRQQWQHRQRLLQQ